jgi:hypothetical protein
VVRRSVALLAPLVGATMVASCATIAGLGDYQLAPQDGAVEGEPAASDGSAGDGDATDADDAASAVDVAEAGDATEDGTSIEDAADAHVDDGPVVPPTDKDHVACGSGSCSVPTEECCQMQSGSVCQAANGGGCNGVIARCDEAANCQPGQVCCVTKLTASGLETECQSSCQGGDGVQSCRTDGECGGTGPCTAWSCAGSVVATCGRQGSVIGCH